MHKPVISPDVVSRVTERRGGVRIFDSIICERTAHIVVDLQNGFMAPGQVAEIGTAREIVPHVNRISDALRNHGVDSGHNVLVVHAAPIVEDAALELLSVAG